MAESKDFDLSQYNISPDSKIYLTIFDSLSTTIRKNPEATLEAFTTVFKEDKNSILIVKTHNLEEVKMLRKPWNLTTIFPMSLSLMSIFKGKAALSDPAV
jgi:hypothetical protein